MLTENSFEKLSYEQINFFLAYIILLYFQEKYRTSLGKKYLESLEMSTIIFIEVPEITEPVSPSLSNSLVYSFIPLFLFNRSIITLANINLIPTVGERFDKSLIRERKKEFFIRKL